jgi:hypothetical protein
MAAIGFRAPLGVVQAANPTSAAIVATSDTAKTLKAREVEDISAPVLSS